MNTASRKIILWLTILSTGASLLAVAVLLVLYALGGESSWQRVCTGSSDLPWGQAIVEKIEPRGEFFCEFHHYRHRNHYFIRIFGRSTAESLERFVRKFDLELLDGDLWNQRLVEKVPGEIRSEFMFNHGDTGFIGAATLKDGKQIAIEGVFSSSSGFFLLELKTVKTD